MLNLYHLRYFVDAAEGGGVSASARKNFLSQSAVSRAIASLEEGLGVELVLHRQNHFQLTEAGQTLLEKSHSLFHLLTDIKDSAAQHLATPQGPLRFGCNQAIASRLVGPMLTEIATQYPLVEPQLKLGNTDQIQSLLDAQEIDFGIVVDDGEVQGHYQTQVIYRDEFVIVKSPRFKTKDLYQHLLVSRVQKGGLSERYLRAFHKAYGRKLTPKLVVSSWQVIMDLAIAGLGIALVPRFLCEEAIRLRQLQIVEHKVKGIPFALCTIVSRNKQLPKNARVLLEKFHSAII